MIDQHMKAFNRIFNIYLSPEDSKKTHEKLVVISNLLYGDDVTIDTLSYMTYWELLSLGGLFICTIGVSQHKSDQHCGSGTLLFNTSALKYLLQRRFLNCGKIEHDREVALQRSCNICPTCWCQYQHQPTFLTSLGYSALPAWGWMAK